MQFKVFSVPVVGGEAVNEELNAFLRGNRILQVEQQLTNSSEGTYWTFCIKYIAGEGRSSGGKKKDRKDYKQILSEEAFSRFSKYRVIRKQIAEEDNIPAFTVFTDEEMAGLAELKELTVAGMKKIKGIGDKKIERYAERFKKALDHEKSK